MTITGGDFDPENLSARVEHLEQLTQQPDFWNDRGQAEKVFAQLKIVRTRYQNWQKLRDSVEDLCLMLQLIEEEQAHDQEAELAEELRRLESLHQVLLTQELLTRETDPLPAFLTIHSGAGGTEACDWASMLYRMYCRWIERRGFKINLVDLIEAEGGIKSVTCQVTGEFASGLLHGETGIHRLVRISPFDSNARRHTSFASVYASPVLDDDIDIDIQPDELRIDTYRSSGAGGQHVNTTDSAVRITHLPTGLTVQCQNERSQHKNRDIAMKMLRSRLYEYYQQQQEAERIKNASEKKDIGWGSQIRSYVFQPYTMVKDLRSRHETTEVHRVMDGDLDPFIDSYLRWHRKIQQQAGQ